MCIEDEDAYYYTSKIQNKQFNPKIQIPWWGFTSNEQEEALLDNIVIVLIEHVLWVVSLPSPGATVMKYMMLLEM